MLDLALLAGGLVILVYAADHFVLGAARLASGLAMPPVVIGAVVMGFGTSAPEMLVSTIAAAQGDLDLGVGNVVGSNVANLSLVLGLAALVTRVNISAAVLKKEALLSVAASAAFALVVIDGSVDRTEGGFLMAGLVAVVAYLVWSGSGEGIEDPDEGTTTGREIGRVTLGLVGTVLGAQMLVSGATSLADTWGFTGGFIGFSLVALGTSLPELVTTLAAARRHETQLIVGNLLGSNIFNSLAVGGGIGLVGPGLVGDDSLTGLGIGLMMAVALVSFGLALMGNFVGRRDGVILFGLYVVAMVALAVGNDDGAVQPEVAPVVSAAESQ